MASAGPGSLSVEAHPPSDGLPVSFPAPLSYAPANRRRRTGYRLVTPHVTQGPLVFFASPQYRTLADPKIRFINRKTCSTFTLTFTLVRFRARSALLSGRWRWAFAWMKLLALERGAESGHVVRCRPHAPVRISRPCSNFDNTWLSCTFAAVAATE